MHSTVPLLDIQHLLVSFRTKDGTIRALQDVSCSIDRGETLGVVGKSGSGKSTLARCVMQLTEYEQGKVYFNGIDLGSLTKKALRMLRPEFQMVFQDPGGSLNPYMTAGSIIGEPLLVHGRASGKLLKKQVTKLLDQVGLKESDAGKYPHEFSGGQKQRIAIARAIALKPSFLLCDEPTSALDVSVQATILNLLTDLKEAHQLTMMFISHDLAVINHCCDRVIVMNEGKIVEEGGVDEIIQSPQHEATRSLIESCQ